MYNVMDIARYIINNNEVTYHKLQSIMSIIKFHYQDKGDEIFKDYLQLFEDNTVGIKEIEYNLGMFKNYIIPKIKRYLDFDYKSDYAFKKSKKLSTLTTSIKVKEYVNVLSDKDKEIIDNIICHCNIDDIKLNKLVYALYTKEISYKELKIILEI